MGVSADRLFLVRGRLNLLLLLSGPSSLARDLHSQSQPVERHLEPSGPCTGVFDLFGALHAFRGVLSSEDGSVICIPLRKEYSL